MKYISRGIIATIGCFVAACSSGDGGLTQNDGDTIITEVISFAVTGTSPEAGGIVPINASVNGGEFTVEWNASASDPYQVILYLSNDDVLSTSDDVDFFTTFCGSDTLLYECADTASFTCRFTATNRISCGTISVDNPETDISAFLDVIPKSAHLILQACNNLLTNCALQSQAIELQ